MLSHLFFYLYGIAVLLAVLALGGFVLGWAFRKGWNRAASTSTGSAEVIKPE